MKDVDIDKQLKIHTTGRDDYKVDDYHHLYEPTPYVVLDRLIESEIVFTFSILLQ